MTQPWPPPHPQQRPSGPPAVRQPGPPPQQWTPPPPPPYYPPPQVIVHSPALSVTRERKSTSHGLHLFLTIITFGMWGLMVWLPLTIWHAWGPRRKIQTRHH